MTTATMRPARLRALAVVGGLLILPRLVFAWFVGVDALQFVASFLMIAGLVMLGVALHRLLLARRPARPLWPLAAAGIAGVLVAGLLTPLLRPTAVAFDGGVLVPLPVVLFQYAWTLVGAVWVVGLVFALASAVVALQRR